MNFVLQFFEAMYGNSISAIFTTLIVVYFILALFGLRSDNTFLKNLASMATGILTTLGILGTFTGIFLGLLNFDVATITKSVPTLLEGLKVAFGTSILGLITALSFRILRPLVAPAIASEDNAEAAVLEALQEMVASVKQSEQSNKEGFEILRKALTGDEDNSVTGQLQRLRAGFSDLESATKSGFEAQIKEFREFAEHMSKAFSEAIIDELKSVIREFNEKISEQFGENFKQLNEAVGKLLVWQENYKTHIETLEKSFEDATNSISATDESMKSISTSVSTIPEYMSKFDEGTEKLNTQLIELHKGLSSIEVMRERAENAFPDISDKLSQITDSVSASTEAVKDAVENQMDTLKSGVNEFTRAVTETTTSLSDTASETKSTLTDTTSEMKNAIEASVSSLSDSAQQTTETLKDSVASLKEEFEKAVKANQDAQNQMVLAISEQIENALKKQKEAQDNILNSFTAQFEETFQSQKDSQQQMLDATQTAFNDTVANATQKLNDSIIQLDEAMQKEIESVVRTMAESLSGIANQFVKDYQPLLAESRKIIELSKQANS